MISILTLWGLSLSRHKCMIVLVIITINRHTSLIPTWRFIYLFSFILRNFIYWLLEYDFEISHLFFVDCQCKHAHYQLCLFIEEF